MIRNNCYLLHRIAADKATRGLFHDEIPVPRKDCRTAQALLFL